jgi:uncharacterized repeat protein (TIGR03803 family)
VIRDTAGNFYGATIDGGAHHQGEVFRINLSAKPKLEILYSFCASAGCTDGAEPGYFDRLTYVGAAQGVPYDGKSTLYGTTPYGGAYGGGTAFSLTPGAHKWKMRVLYNFDDTTGYIATGVLSDGTGNLFGTTNDGGPKDKGVIFELSPAEKGWKETVLYNLCGEPKCTDGANPSGSLTMDSAGNLLGGTYAGGAKNAGALFKLIPNGAKSQYSVIYSFCGLRNCSDGESSYGPLALDKTGDIYGISSYGSKSGGYGVLYRLHGSTLQVLHTFCSDDNCIDGGSPLDGIVQDPSGHLFGTADLRGANGQGGTVYEFKP